MSILQECSIESMQHRVNLAINIGWVIITEYTSDMLLPPDNFKCIKFCAEWKEYSLSQGTLFIPHYFEDDHIMLTGMWDDNINYSKSSSYMQRRVNLGLKLGWKIIHDDSNTLVPPNHFKCDQFGATWKSYVLEQGSILIPDYFEDDYIMVTGHKET